MATLGFSHYGQKRSPKRTTQLSIAQLRFRRLRGARVAPQQSPILQRGCALAHLGRHRPAAIEQLIVVDPESPDGNDFIVRLYDIFGVIQEQKISLELTRGQDAVKLSGDYDNSGVEVWPQILEQAYAQFYGGYSNIENGLCSTAWRALTGEAASSDDVSATYPLPAESDQEIAIKIVAKLDAGKGVMIGTLDNNPSVLVADHAYSVS